MQQEKDACKVTIYVEHDVVDKDADVRLPRCVDGDMVDRDADVRSDAEVMCMDKGKEKVVENEEEDITYDTGVSSSEEDEVRCVTLDDSEDERGVGLDDGFGLEYSLPKNGTNRVMIEGKEYRVKKRACKNPTKKKTKVASKGPVLLEDVQIDGDYESDELGSSDPDDSDREKGPKYERFRKTQLCKTFQFKVGVEFSSTKEFKEAIIEWTVLNGYEIKFVKNDLIRCRVVCKKREKDDCMFLALCSQVNGQHTYRIKTWDGDHTCLKVGENRSATSKWVSKAVVPALMSNENLRVTTIMDDMRRDYGVGITFGRAWKAKMIARKSLMVMLPNNTITYGDM